MDGKIGEEEKRIGESKAGKGERSVNGGREMWRLVGR